MKILSIDPSLTGTGLCATTTADPALTSAETIAISRRGHDRLDAILAEIREWARAADLAVIEGPSYGNQGKSRQTGHHERAGLWWLIAHEVLWRARIPYVVVSPAARAKYATGKGNANKDAVLQAATRRYSAIEFDGNNEADALILAAMAADHYGYPIAPVPQTHRVALANIEWPDMPVVHDLGGVA